MSHSLTAVQQQALDRAIKDYEHWTAVVQWQTERRDAAKACLEPWTPAGAAKFEQAERWLRHAQDERYRSEAILSDLQNRFGLIS